VLFAVPPYANAGAPDGPRFPEGPLLSPRVARSEENHWARASHTCGTAGSRGPLATWAEVIRARNAHSHFARHARLTARFCSEMLMEIAHVHCAFLESR